MLVARLLAQLTPYPPSTLPPLPPRRGPLLLAALVVAALGCIFAINLADLVNAAQHAHDDKPVGTGWWGGWVGGGGGE